MILTIASISRKDGPINNFLYTCAIKLTINICRCLFFAHSTSKWHGRFCCYGGHAASISVGCYGRPCCRRINNSNWSWYVVDIIALSFMLSSSTENDESYETHQVTPTTVWGGANFQVCVLFVRCPRSRDYVRLSSSKSKSTCMPIRVINALLLKYGAHRPTQGFIPRGSTGSN